MSTAYSPRSKDAGWANTCPYIVLTVTKDSETSTSVKYKYSLEYKTQGSIPSANSEKREWAVKFGSTTASSGSKAIMVNRASISQMAINLSRSLKQLHRKRYLLLRHSTST